MSEENIFEVKEFVSLEDGKHEGKIHKLSIEKRKDYTYVDVLIKMKDEPLPDIKVGYPATVSEMSGFGRLLVQCGLNLKPGEKHTLKDLEKVMKGKKVVFQTHKSEEGFSNVIADTVKVVE